MNSSDSNSDCYEIRYNNGKFIPSSSPLTRKHEEDDNNEVSGPKAMLTRRKRLKTTFLSPSSSSKMIWTRTDELLILAGIVDYEIEKELSYKDDWDALYKFIKGSIDSKFSKKQLTDKIRGLKKRFTDNLAKSEDGKGPSFTSTDDDEIFKLSMIIWATKNETEFGSNENLDQGKDVPYVEHERIDENADQAKIDVPYDRVNENVDQAKVHKRVHVLNKDASYVQHKRVHESMEQAKVDVPYVEPEQINENVDQAKDVSYAEHDEQVNESMDQEKVDVSCGEHERVSNISMEIDDGEKEKKSEEDGVDEFCVLQDAFEAILFPTLGKTHQKLLLHNLRNLKDEKRKELSGEWKALLVEEVQLYIKKLAFSSKLANKIAST